MANLTLGDDVHLFYTEDGTGEPVILLHGWCCDSHDWSWLIPKLAADRRVIALDLRGHGRSSAPAAGYDPRQLAEDVAAVLRALEATSAVVIGHSLGTVVASALAVLHPEMVRGLVLVDPIYGNDDERINSVLAMVRDTPGDGQRAAGFGGGFYSAATPEFVPTWHRRRAAGTPRHVTVGCLAGLFEGDDAIGRRSVARTFLRGRMCPRLAIYRSASLAAFEREFPTGANDAIEVWEGAGHFLHIEQPERFAGVVATWLDRVPARTSPAASSAHEERAS
jgi:pimeloyl-ACP methyl ester carboxylesterase